MKIYIDFDGVILDTDYVISGEFKSVSGIEKKIL